MRETKDENIHKLRVRSFEAELPSNGRDHFQWCLDRYIANYLGNLQRDIFYHWLSEEKFDELLADFRKVYTTDSDMWKWKEQAVPYSR